MCLSTTYVGKSAKCREMFARSERRFQGMDVLRYPLSVWAARDGRHRRHGGSAHLNIAQVQTRSSHCGKARTDIFVCGN